MKMRTMLGLAAIGGALYMHKRRGGEFTVDSIKQSLNDLWNAISSKAEEVSEAVKREQREGIGQEQRGTDSSYITP